MAHRKTYSGIQRINKSAHYIEQRNYYAQSVPSQ